MLCPNCNYPTTVKEPDEPHLNSCLNCGTVFSNNPESNIKDYRQYIKEQLKLKNITIYKLAKVAGLRSRKTLYNYLDGRDIMISTLNKILKALESIPKQK